MRKSAAVLLIALTSCRAMPENKSSELQLFVMSACALYVICAHPPTPCHNGTGRTFITFMGGTSADQANNVCAASDGGTLVTGTAGGNIPSLGGQTPLMSWMGGSDGLVVKLSPSGTVEWYTLVGGPSGEVINGAYETTDGGFVVTGTAPGTFGPLMGKSALVAAGAATEWFVVKFSSTGTVEWWTFLGSGGADQAYGITQIADGSIVAGGFFGANQASISGKTPLNSYNAMNDIVLAKFSLATGALQSYTYLGGASQDQLRFMTATGDGGIALAGESNGSTTTMQGKTVVNAYTGGNDHLVIKVTSALAVEWFTFMGSATADVPQGIVEGYDGSLLVAGRSDANAVVQGKSPRNAHSGAVDDFFVAKLTSQGSLIWHTYLGGTGNQQAWGIVPSESFGAYVAGNTDSNVASIQGRTPQEPFAGTGAMMLAEVSSGGDLVYYSMYGGSGTTVNAYSLAQSYEGGRHALLLGGSANQGISTYLGQTPVNAFAGPGGTADAFLFKVYTNGYF